MNVFFFLPYLNAVPINLVPGYFAHIVEGELIGIIAKSYFQATFSFPLPSSLFKFPIFRVGTVKEKLRNFTSRWETSKS